MSIPRVAIVGRPNVGKSSLLNMLAREKVSIVDSVPGVTRDRVTTIVELTGPLKTEAPKLIELIDTGGYGVYTAEGGRFDDAGEDLASLTGQIEAQIAAAVEEADLILFVTDAQAGVTPVDEAIATMLRERRLGDRRLAAAPGRAPARVQVVANKVDSMAWEPHGLEAAGLGFGEPWLISATLNYMRRDFRDRLFEAVPYDTGRGDDDAVPEMKIALVGRRNAGKSTFVNALAGEERCIVSEIAGTTRDALDVRFEIGGRTCVAIDTAGVRKRTRFADRVEHWAFERCQAAIARADVVLLLIDATQKLAGVDKRLGRAVHDEFKPCVVVVTKWDLARGRKNRQGKPVSPQDFQAYIEKEMPGLADAPMVFTSGVEGLGVAEAVEVAFELHEQASQRVPTGELNRFFRDLLERRGPSSALGTRAKIYYVSQVGVRPPTIVMVVNRPKLFGPEYTRYLLNRIRDELPFDEVPVRLIVRERRRAELNEMIAGGRERGAAVFFGADDDADDDALNDLLLGDDDADDRG